MCSSRACLGKPSYRIIIQQNIENDVRFLPCCGTTAVRAEYRDTHYPYSKAKLSANPAAVRAKCPPLFVCDATIGLCYVAARDHDLVSRDLVSRQARIEYHNGNPQ
jgi:hypothetical protein